MVIVRVLTQHGFGDVVERIHLGRFVPFSRPREPREELGTESQATLVVLLNTDVLHDQTEPSTLFGQAITRIVTPEHVFNIPVTGARPSPQPTS